ncbi:pitrilysin family protein [Algivirga pacifica]|uniref:Pitrilysin family protein n=1 Tax=Algivirga pacifica TaxID=1162670 RepID=A0ABP9DKE4_9BACT
MDFDIHRFDNGIRLIHKQVKSTKIAHCGLILNIGSRDEKAHQQGIAHFWEHMAFKGTEKRKAFHILSRLDSVGGELNAYTTKEKICFYASSMVEHFEKSAELITDITFHSTFPQKEIIKERGVILEEMSMYQDDPADAITDEFDEQIFRDHQLGKNILGNRESVMGFQQEDFTTFIDENLNTEEIIFSSVSNLPFHRVKRIVEKYLKDIPYKKTNRERIPFKGYTPTVREAYKNITQAHCVIGAEAYSFHHTDRLPFFLLINLLGGPGMNSRLNLQVREKYGYVYDIMANYVAFQDTGLFSINFATETGTLQKCIKLVHKELKKVREQKLGPLQLHMAKQQLKGQIAMGEEGNLSLMLGMGKNLIDKQKLDTLEEVFAELDAITADKIMDVANHIMAPERLSTLVYLPK